MVRLMSAEELVSILGNIHTGTLPAIEKAMLQAALNVEGEAKKYCTPGQSPYYRAPYSDDDDPRREPPHMRDTIKGVAVTTGNQVRGFVGTPKYYAFWVHEGTTRMVARPFIMDAVKAKDRDTRALLSEAIQSHLRSFCE